MKNNLPQFYRNRSKGSIAVLTLWAVLFLASLSLGLSREVAGRLQVASEMKWRPRVLSLGSKALLEAVTLIGEDKTQVYDSLQEPWASGESHFKDVAFNGGTYSLVSYENSPSEEEKESRYGLADEDRKINLNRAPAAVLSRLFQIRGELSELVAYDLALFIVDWRDGNVAKGQTNAPEDCSYLSPPAHCKNQDFEVLEELLWIPGITAGLFEKIKKDLTLYGTGLTNINTATTISLMAHGLSESGASKIIAWREAGNTFENVSWITGRSNEFSLEVEDHAALATAASSGLFGLRSDAFEGIVQVKFGGRERGHIGFIFKRDGKVLSWRE